MIIDKNVRIIKFGTGDIGVASLGNAVYFMENNQYLDIPQIEGQAVIDLVNDHTKVIMTFDDVHGIDITIEALEKAKKYLYETRNEKK